MVEAQCALDTECFSDTQVAPLTKYVAATGTTPATKIVAQNGAFLMIDKANYTATIPNTADSENGFPMGINYSTEKIYSFLNEVYSSMTNIQKESYIISISDW